MPDTIPTRPSSFNRPHTGLAAWEATVGYIATEHSPDAMLTLRAYPEAEETIWSAELTWGQNKEQLGGVDTLADVLRELWLKVEQSHVIFKSSEDAVRKPAGYGNFDWIDSDTKDALDRLAWVTSVVFKDDWTLISIYQPTDNPTARVQMRLVARDTTVHINGRGASMRDAATQLYRNATPYFSGNKD